MEHCLIVFTSLFEALYMRDAHSVVYIDLFYMLYHTFASVHTVHQYCVQQVMSPGATVTYIVIILIYSHKK